jgi:glutaredoxin
MNAMSLRDWWTGRSREDRLDPLDLVLYTRRTCPLCDEMKHAIAEADLPVAHVLREVDIDSDPALVERFGRSIPVLAIDGHVAFKGRLTARDLVRKVERARREKPRA